jgi:predicted nucleotidyltransferase
MPKVTPNSRPTQARRRQALEAAEQCIALLKEKFGATRVILFGSLVGPGVWHEQSDIDLAVEGLAPQDFFKAYGDCLDLLPSGMNLDLVPLENAYPEMRARILGEVEMADDPIQALRDMINDEFITLRRVVEEMTETLAQVRQPPTHIELRAIASLLHEFYNGIEKIFERIAVSLGEGLPRGSAWHVDLLNQLAEPQTGGRTAVIDEPLRAKLEEYRKFRHFFRHAYGYTLEWARMQWLAELMSDSLRLLREQVEAFFGGLSDES